MARWIGIVVLVFVVVAMAVLGVVYGPALGLGPGVAPPSSGSTNSTEPSQPKYVTVERYEQDRAADLKLIEGNTAATASNQGLIEAKAKEIAANQEAIRANSESIAANRTQLNDVLEFQDRLHSDLEQIIDRTAVPTHEP